MKRVLAVLLAVVIALLSAACGKSDEPDVRYEFSFPTVSGVYTSKMYYDDSLFGEASDVYQPSLATASLSLALTAINSGADTWKDKSENAIALLKRLGYADVEPNAYYQEKPTADSLGCIFGHKEIGGRQMIACGIRGGNYGNEWSSNFTVGETGYHQGFFEGSEVFFSSLKDYLHQHKITGDIRLWMTGYSRGAAVCNIAAGRLDEAIAQKKKLLGGDITVAKDDLYAYCFESPQGVSYDDSLYPKSAIFNNIFCIVNFNDGVTKMAMKEFSFTRYGVDKVLFDPLNDIAYAEHIETVKEIFNAAFSESNRSLMADDFRMKSFSGLTFTDSTEYCHWPQGLFIVDFLSLVTTYGLKTREFYTEEVQQGMRDIFTLVFAASTPTQSVLQVALSLLNSGKLSESFEILKDDLLNHQGRLVEDFKTGFNNLLEVMHIDVDVNTVTHAAEKLLGAIFVALLHEVEFTLALPLFSKENLLAFAQVHLPEVTLSYLRALDPKYSDDPIDCSLDGKYYYVEITDTSADVSVTCSGAEIARFENGTPVDLDSSVPYTSHRKLRIYLPYHAAYTITASSDAITVKQYDPAAVGFIDCDMPLIETVGGYTMTIPEN